MALREIQAFLTRYIRDPYFREQWKGEGRTALRAELGLTNMDIEQLHQVPLQELDVAADSLRSDRINKRRSEFAQFLDHLELYVPVEEFLQAYDASYTMGREILPVEVDWFLSYSMKFVSKNGLPEYLISLALFCYLYTRMAFTPLAFSENTLENPRENGVEAYHMVKLFDPFRIESFRYDALGIATLDPVPGEIFEGNPTQLLFLKSRLAFKRSTIWRLEDLPPYISALIEGPKALSDLLGIQDAASYQDIVENLLNYHDSGLIEFIVPSNHLI